MDEHNALQLWGVSPAVDLRAVLPQGVSPSSSLAALDDAASAGAKCTAPLRILQVASYDARHTLTTLARASRALGDHLDGPLHLYVHEEEPEGLARHLLLLLLLLDPELPARERCQLLLEVHGNALLRESTAVLLERKGRQLEVVIVRCSSGQGSSSSAAMNGVHGSTVSKHSTNVSTSDLAQVVDLSLLRFQERDQLLAVLQRYRQSTPYDMVQGWDVRCRKWYADRFDFRRNLVDYDYHMRLHTLGLHGRDAEHGTVIHFHHFRYWRMHGIAYELRDCVYQAPNRSLLSTAYGRTKEFKDRSGKDVGRSVAAFGLWGDILNSPYHAFGTVCEEDSFFAVSNKQYSRTAIDIAEHNVMALLHELRTGQQFTLAEGAEATRAQVARGPTSMADLEQENAKHAQKEQQQEPQQQQQSTNPDAPASSSEGSPAAASSSNPVLPAVTEEDEEPGEVGQAPADPVAAVAGSVEQLSLDGGQSHDGESNNGVHQSMPNGNKAADSDLACQSSGSTGLRSSTASQQMAAESERLRLEELALDEAAWTRVRSRLRLFLVSGDVSKSVAGKAKFRQFFDLITVGHRHVHLVAPDHGLQNVARPAGRLMVENGRFLLQLKKEQAETFADKIKSMAADAGWRQVQPQPAAVTSAHTVFERPL